MSLVSAVPGKLLSATVQLPAPAVGVVSWVIRDYQGATVVRGQCAASGTAVVVSTVLPSKCKIPTDGSKYSLTCSDGKSSAVEYFSVVSQNALEVAHGVEVVYVPKRVFKDSLILPYEAESVSCQVTLQDGWLSTGTCTVTAEPERRGESWVYTMDYSQDPLGSQATPPGSIDTHTGTTLGVGTITWDYTPCDAIDASQEFHPLFTVTPYSMNFMTSIRMMVDKARIGDVNEYLRYTVSDLCHALIRGADYVMQSPPVAGPGMPLDVLPISLRDYIIKAGAVDILRAQYQAEAMSQMDLQGLGVQLNIDRTQALDGLINQLVADLANLPAAKNDWLAQGAPMGSMMAGGKRPIGTLGLTRGVYSPWPMYPLPIVMGGVQFLGGGYGYGPLY